MPGRLNDARAKAALVVLAAAPEAAVPLGPVERGAVLEPEPEPVAEPEPDEAEPVAEGRPEGRSIEVVPMLEAATELPPRRTVGAALTCQSAVSTPFEMVEYEKQLDDLGQKAGAEGVTV